MSETLKCIVRIKPSGTNDLEKRMNDIVIKQIDKHNIFVEAKFENRNYMCDYVADENSSQSEIYDEVGVPILKSFLQGYNCTMFSYGQTGSGKTYTMLGPTNSLVTDNNTEKRGVIPRLIKGIYQEINKLKKDKKLSNFSIKCSCFEIYQETIIDLLNNKQSNLNIREDTKKGIFIENLTEQVAEDEKSALEIMLFGIKNRHVAALSINSDSSRSHMVFSIHMNLSSTNDSGLIVNKSNRLHLIDLAGSERQKLAGIENKADNRVKESSAINKSLLILGNVINAIVESKFTPYRESKLTFFLKESLSGNSQTTIIANISPCIVNVQDSISTLKFIQRAKQIKNNVCVNENVSGSSKALQDEIKRLKEELEKLEKEKAEKQYICESCLRNKSINNMMGAQHFMEVNNKVRKTVRKSMILNQALIEELAKENNNTIKEEEENEKKSYGSVASGDDIIDKDNISIKERIKKFIAKIEFLLNYETVLKDKVQDMQTVSKGVEELNQIRENYIKESKEFNEQLDKKSLHLHSIVKINENFVSGKQANSNDGKCNNQLSQNQINMFLEESGKLRNTFDQDLLKLKKENEYLNLKKDYDLLKGTKNIDLIFSKENIDVLITVFNDFIESNRDLQAFLSEHIQCYIKDEVIEKMKIELEELKSSQKALDGMLDDMKNENYLLNVENNKLKEKELINTLGTEIEKKYIELQDKYDNVLKEYDNSNNSIEEKSQEIQKLKKLMVDLEQRSEKKDLQIKQLLDEIDTLADGNKIFEDEILKGKGEVEQLLEEQEGLKNKVNSLEEVNSYNENLLSQYSEELAKINSAIKMHEEENKSLKNANEEMTKELEENKENLNELMTENEKLSEKLKGLVREYKQKDKDRERMMRDADDEKMALDERIKELINEIVLLEEKIENMKKECNSEKETLKDKISSLTNDIKSKDLERERVIQEFNKERESLNNIINEMNNQKDFKEKEEDRKEIEYKKEIEKLRDDIKRCDIQDKLIKDEVNQLKNEKGVLCETVKRIKEDKENLNNENMLMNAKMKEIEINANNREDTLKKEFSKEIEELNEKIRILIIEGKTKDNDIETLLKEIESLKKKIKEFFDEANLKDQQNEIKFKELTKERDTLINKINQISEEARTNLLELEKKNKFNCQEKDELKAKIEKLIEDGKNIEITKERIIKELEKENSILNERIKGLQNDIKSSDTTSKTQIDELRKEILEMNIKLNEEKREKEKEIEKIIKERETQNDKSSNEYKRDKEILNEKITNLIESVNQKECIIQVTKNGLDKIKREYFEKTREYDNLLTKLEKLTSKYHDDKTDLENKVNETEIKMNEYKSLYDQNSQNNNILENSLKEIRKEHNDILNKYRELLEMRENIDTLNAIFHKYNTLYSQMNLIFFSKETNFNQEELDKKENEFKGIIEEIDQLINSQYKLSNNQTKQEIENNIKITKSLLDQLYFLKINSFTNKKKYKALKVECKALRLENQRLSEEKKYEDNLNKILNQLSILPIINESINKKNYVTNNTETHNLYISTHTDPTLINLKSKIQSLEIDNKQLREKIIYISEQLAAQELNSSIHIENVEHSHLKNLIILLGEEKKRLENEVSLLSSDYYSKLSESGLNDKIQVLLQLKEEYYKQKLELEDLRNRNELLQVKLKHYENTRDKNNVVFTDKVMNQLSTISECSAINDYEIIRKEHAELIERILALKVDCLSKAKTKYNKALDYLKAMVKVLDIQKLYKDFFEGQISNLNERVTTTFTTDKKEMPIEKEIINFMEQDVYNVVEIKGTVNVEGRTKVDKTSEPKQSKLYNKIFEDRGKTNNIKPSTDRSSNTSVSKNNTKNTKISSKTSNIK